MLNYTILSFKVWQINQNYYKWQSSTLPFIVMTE